MLEYIHGRVEELTPAYAVIDVAGVGYLVNISLNTFTAMQNSETARLYLYEAIREDAYTLYGFADKTERALFLLLISVSGVGAATARMMLSSLSVPEICEAINTGDERLLKSVKGLGAKSAQRIIVDLRDKIAQIDAGESSPSGLTASSSEAKNEALAALTMLGFAPAQARKALEKVLSESPNAPVDELIKKSLKLM
ncbi:MAG: Holliday junction branch migration protein RuvA [Paludibacteraceae bacterium]|nr:Holliday junction branch migration protein RuvA [Paludibacteraceae bacterium]